VRFRHASSTLICSITEPIIQRLLRCSYGSILCAALTNFTRIQAGGSGKAAATLADDAARSTKTSALDGALASMNSTAVQLDDKSDEHRHAPPTGLLLKPSHNKVSVVSR
jgi:hypothetical protein